MENTEQLLVAQVVKNYICNSVAELRFIYERQVFSIRFNSRTK